MTLSDDRLTVSAAALVFLSFAVPASMLGVIWTDVRSDFDLSVGALGWVSLAYGLARMSTAMSGRPFVRRLGMGRAFVSTLALLGVSSLALSVAATWPLFLAAVAGVGMTSGLLDSIGAIFITRRGQVGTAGLIHGSYGLGATIGPLIVAIMPGWRSSIVVATIVATLALGLGLRARSAWPHSGEPKGSTTVSSTDLPVRAVALSLALFTTFVAIEVTTGIWTFTYLTEGRGSSDGAAAIAVAGFWAGTTTGRLLLTHRSVAEFVARVGMHSLVGLSTLSLMSLVLLPPRFAVAPLVVGGLLIGPVVPSLFATTSSRVGFDNANRMAGWQLLATNLGAITVPGATGLLVDRAGPQVVIFVIMSTMALIGLPLLLTLRRLPTIV